MASNSDHLNPDQMNPNSTLDILKQRILVPTLLAGIAGGGVGLLSKHRKVHGLSKITATMQLILLLSLGVTVEHARVSRTGKPDDLLNSAIGGFGSGAILGRLQAGQAGAVRYSVLFAVVGTSIDDVTLKLKPAMSIFTRKDGWFRLPEWSPIQYKYSTKKLLLQNALVKNNVMLKFIILRKKNLNSYLHFP